MEQITINEALKDAKINELKEEIKQLKKIIAWQSFRMAGMKTGKLTLKKK